MYGVDSEMNTLKSFTAVSAADDATWVQNNLISFKPENVAFGIYLLLEDTRGTADDFNKKLSALQAGINKYITDT